MLHANLIDHANATNALFRSDKGTHRGPWTDERIAHLKQLWREGVSASLIAKVMSGSGLTRNAIIGKVHRLGLPRRKGALAGNGRNVRSARPAERHVSTIAMRRSPLLDLPTAPLPPPSETDIARVTMDALEPHHCRWPVGDPKQAGFGFCGCAKVAGLSYCADHARRAFRPPEVGTKAVSSWTQTTRVASGGGHTRAVAVAS